VTIFIVRPGVQDGLGDRLVSPTGDRLGHPTGRPGKLLSAARPDRLISLANPTSWTRTSTVV
jgi:hypothetical protein